MIRQSLLTVAVVLGLQASAQTLFTYGKDSVSVQEFLKAYEKNNPAGKNPKAMQEYLDLYITARLKIKEAKERGYDTLPNIVSEMQNLREQILPSYLNDPQSLNQLVNEAFDRSQKDIHLSHIFIPVTGDTTSAYQKALQAYQQLQKGSPFATVAKEFSADPSAVANGGDLGFITVFSLPYALENLAYTTPVGKISPLYRSKAGYHIFKNTGKRKAMGRMRAAQILIAFPPGADAAAKLEIKKLADSLYNRLMKGDDFSKLAAQFSADPIAAHTEGKFPEFGVGQYEAAFETAVFALSKDGAISKPFATGHGYHIIKRLNKLPVNTDRNNAEAMQQLKDKVLQDERVKTIQTAEEDYQQNLEKYNPEFRKQMNEFLEGNLFFEIMQKEVWGPAQNDTIALQNYYELHKEQYTWNKSADAIVFYANDAATAQQLLAQLKKTPANWRKLVEQNNEKVTADSARFEWSSIPGINGTSRNKTFTQPQINKADNTAAFAYIIEVNNKPVQRTFTEARGSVINDYGIELEKKWVEELKKKYPVKRSGAPL